MLRSHAYTTLGFMLLLCCTGMFFPGLQAPLGIPHPFVHVSVFFICTTLVLALDLLPPKKAFLFLVILAFGLEFGQLFVPNREAEIGDVLCNLYGIALSYGVLKIIGLLQRLFAPKAL